MPAATDQFSKYLRAAPTTPAQLERVADFLMDSGRSIYNWQNYQMWVALTDKKHQSKPLSLFASQVVATNEDSPSRAGASLYLGASGDSSGKELVANRFQHQLQAGSTGDRELESIVCNAGAQFRGPVTYSADGFEETFAGNCLGHFLMTNLLLDSVVKGSPTLERLRGVGASGGERATTLSPAARISRKERALVS
jgi:NAD(P)-dependent dehydrogenase (short-subunit alcohol dehydrogenase family)